jgi:hypothetical protein
MSFEVFAINKNVIKKKKKTRMNFLKYGLKTWFIKLWNVDGALVKPKGITKNS